MHAVLFVFRIDHDDRFRHPVHVADAFQVPANLLVLSFQSRLALLRVRRHFAAFLKRVEFVESLQPAADGAEVCQRATEPTLADVRHSRSFSRFLDRLSRLAFGSDKEDETSGCGNFLQVPLSSQYAANCLFNVDDVDEIPAAVNVRSHFRIPSTRAVTKMDTRLQHVLHINV